ncbi:hypothetical protein HV824_09445 [Myxococcus sp. AM009]|uniref:hypothetical protein n=1 Tax=unclassified Myxococcus TaxID=2648731 RepID=UPI001595BE7B|nr:MULTISPECIES: hypothetical protein [unclassified Myxococcus]NVI98344.1 hypothetical protein [Myxococcus sp. AM009]NVJ13372.1 hypothetical protein [Myxococcus sp. AM010]
MRERNIRRWGSAAALMAGAVLAVGCRGLPETGGSQPDEPRGNFAAQRGDQPAAMKNMEGGDTNTPLPPWTLPANRGYNGTIDQIGSSIDPRTAKNDGTQGRSIIDDAGKMMGDQYNVQGGAAYSPAAQGLGGEDGAALGGKRGGHSSGFSPLGWQDRSGPYRR